jgi:hypothetical protein
MFPFSYLTSFFRSQVFVQTVQRKAVALTAEHPTPAAGIHF